MNRLLRSSSDSVLQISVVDSPMNCLVQPPAFYVSSGWESLGYYTATVSDITPKLPFDEVGTEL